MGNRNAPGCGQILAACALVIFGTLGGCAIGDLTNLAPWSGSWSFYLWLVGGGLVGGFLAVRILRG